MKRSSHSGSPALFLVGCLLGPLLARGGEHGAAETVTEQRPNPIRKVLTMLTMLGKKVKDEGQKEQVSFDKYMCYCHANSATLQKEIDEAEQRIPQLQSAIEEAKSLVQQLEQELEKHHQERGDAKEALEQATEIRNKEAADFDSFKADSESNIKALGEAIQKLEGGIAGAAGSFLQKATTDTLRRLSASPEMGSTDREALESFLDEGADLRYSPQSSEILGILKQMKDNMNQELMQAIATESKATQEFEVMKAAKSKEIEAAETAIESKGARVSATNVDIVNTEQDLDDTSDALTENTKFLAQLTADCKTKQAQWIEHEDMRTQELKALDDTTRILSNGDTLNIFKDALPTPVSFMQVARSFSRKEARDEALKILRAARAGGKLPWKLNLLALAIGGKKVGFDAIIKMIDEMTALKAKEQQNDEEKKKNCQAEFDKSTIKHDELTQVITDQATMIEEKTGKIASLKEEIAELVMGIKELDQSVADYTASRKADHAETVDTLVSNNAAIELLQMAKMRLQEFYGKQKTGESLVQLEEDAEIAKAISDGKDESDKQAPDAPESPQKNSEENGSAVARLIKMLTDELKTEMTTLQKEDKKAQQDYEEFLSIAKDKRALDAKNIAEKEGAQAGLEAGLHKLRGERKKRVAEKLAVEKYVAVVHKDCDELMKKYDTWSEARASEVEALKRAKEILLGA